LNNPFKKFHYIIDGYNTSRKITFHGRISPRLTGNRIEKKRGDIFEIKCNDTTAVVVDNHGCIPHETHKCLKLNIARDTTEVGARTAVVRHTNIKKNCCSEISPRLFPESRWYVDTTTVIWRNRCRIPYFSQTHKPAPKSHITTQNVERPGLDWER